MAAIDDILTRLAKLLDATTDSRVKEALPGVIKDLKAYAQDQETQRNKLLDTLNQQKSTIDELQGTVAALQKTTADQAQQIDALKKQLAGVGAASSATPLNLATSFKGVIDAVQAEARQTPGVATTIKSMDIEVKGLVQVSSDQATQLVLPAVGSAIDPNALSTLRISFGAIPVAGTAAATPAPTPTNAPTVPPATPSVPPGRVTQPAPGPRGKARRGSGANVSPQRTTTAPSGKTSLRGSRRKKSA